MADPTASAAETAAAAVDAIQPLGAAAPGRTDRRSSSTTLDRETGPDLTWQWTLAVVVCAALAGVFKKRKYVIEFN